MALDAQVRWQEPDLVWVTGREARPPRFPLEAFSDDYQCFIKLTAEATNTQPDWAGTILFPITSAAVGNTRRVQAHQDWIEPLIFWAMVLGISGDGKTPILKKLIEPLEDIEDVLVAGWRRAKEAIEAANENAAEGEPKQPIPPEPEIIIQDATAERVVKMLQNNPRGGLAWQDEIMGLINSFDRYRGGKKASGDQQFWLTAFGGNRWKRSRIIEEDGSVIVNLWFSLMGGIQPEVFATLLTGPNDGFLARFLYSYPEPLPPSWPSQFPDQRFLKSVLQRLHSLDFATADDDGNPRQLPILMKLTDKAVERFITWRQTRYTRQRLTGGLYQTWLGKADGYVLRFAGMLALLDWAAGPPAAPPLIISDSEIERGILLFDEYYAPMARQVFGDAALNSDEYGARVIAKNIVNVSRNIVITRESGLLVVNVDKIRRAKLIHTLNTAESVRLSLGLLVKSGWLMKAYSRDASHPGRESQDYAINPKVFVEQQATLNVKSPSAPSMSDGQIWE